MRAFLLGVHPGESPNAWIGDVPDHWHDVMFGGCVIGQSITAFTRDAPNGRRLHSLHGYFLRPTGGGVPITYEVEPVRDGKAFSTRRLTASQRGKGVFEAIASFTDDTDGYVYDLPHTSALPSRNDGESGYGVGGFDAVYYGATEQRGDGTYESTDRKWFRLPVDMGDDVHVHTAYVGMASDWTGIGPAPSTSPGTTTSTASRRLTTRCGSTARLVSTSGCTATCTRWSTSAAAARSA